jgi:hypothetical protein
MGSTMSFRNDTKDVIMVKRTANTKVISPIAASIVAIAGTAATVMTGGLTGGVTVSGTIITYTTITAIGIGTTGLLTAFTSEMIVNEFEDSLISEYEKKGFRKINPGKEHRWGKQSLSLNQRMWCVRLDQDDNVMYLRSANSSVWTGGTKNKNIRYKASSKYFDWELVDTYTVEGETSESRAEGDTLFVDPRDPTCGGTKVLPKLFGCF